MANEYYILKPAVDTPETGNAYPAAESYDDYDFNAPNSVHKLNFREFPDFEPDIRFKLAKGAKLTDMLSQAAISAHGFLSQRKAETTFEQLRSSHINISLLLLKIIRATFTNTFGCNLFGKKPKTLFKWEESSFYKKRLSKNLGDVTIKKEEDILD